MPHRILFTCFVLLSFMNTTWAQVDSFKPLGRFLVPGGGSAEIISVSPDGNRVVYSNAETGTVGIVDISVPTAPILIGDEVDVEDEGEPTSAVYSPDGKFIFVGVQKSYLEEDERPFVYPGNLLVLRARDGRRVGDIRIGPGPDSVAATEINGKTVVVVAIENEPIVVDEKGKLTDDDEPGNPGDISDVGYVQVITVDSRFFRKSVVKTVMMPDKATLESLGLLFPDDPQPEFVDITSNGMVVVSLQENNGMAIIDINDPMNPVVTKVFSLGTVGDRLADLSEDEQIALTETYPLDVASEDFAGARFPDAIAWNSDGTAIVSADEGEMNFSGGRGFSLWSPDGDFLWDDGGEIESYAVALGHYPEGRSENKGVEMEGVDTGIYGSKEFAFVCSERGSFIVVYDITDPTAPVFVQVLPTGIAPEGVKALPSRNLFMTADEGDDGNGSISFFEGMSGMYVPSADQPTIMSSTTSWSALSGLAASTTNASVLYSVPDNALLSEIYKIEVGAGIAPLTKVADVTKSGEKAAYDLEGIAIDTSIIAPADAGYWLANEGDGDFGEPDHNPNLLVQVNASGEVLLEIALPVEVEPLEAPADNTGTVRGNGFEGVTVSSDGRYLLAAIQRGYNGEPEVDGVKYTRIGRYDLVDNVWDFFLYPLEETVIDGDWIGLSEITNLGGDVYAVIERDKQFGAAATVKKVYSFSLSGVSAFNGVLEDTSDLTGKVISKTEVADLLEDFSPFEKIEGLTKTIAGDLWALLDNDGGELESRFVKVD